MEEAPVVLGRSAADASLGRLLMTAERRDALMATASSTPGEWADLRMQARATVDALQRAIAAGGGGDFALRDQIINAAIFVNAGGDDAGASLPRDLARAVVAFARHLQDLPQQNPVARGAMTVSLALAYDLLHDHLDQSERRDLAKVLVDQAIVTALDGSFRPRGNHRRQWWADSATNWTTLIIGGSVLSALAIRDDDAPAQARISDGQDAEVEQSWPMMRKVALKDGLDHLQRCFLPIIRNGGGTNEGNGYHHDMLLPLMLASEAVHLNRASPVMSDLAAEVASYTDRAIEAARWQIHGDIHVSSPLPGVDFDYADGAWSLSDQPVTYLVATWARRGADPSWRAAAWMADQRCIRPTSMRAVFRADIAWSRSGGDAPAGMADFRADAIPTGRHLFQQTIPPGEPGTNEHLVIWRQRFGDRLAAAVMFKGGDRRQDRHSALDAGTFSYVGQGVFWNRRPGWTGDYRYYRRDNRPSGSEVTLLHLFAKRAAGQNTLLVNPAENDYSRGLIPPPMTWLSQVNPDQAVGEDRISQPLSPVEGVAMPATGAWTAVIRYAPAYARHGVVDARGGARTGRMMRFEPMTGSLEVHDELIFARPAGNAVIWGMYLSPEVALERLEEDRALLSAVAIDQRRVYMAVIRAGRGPAFHLLQGPDLAPPGAPRGELLWRYLNGDRHQRTCRRLVFTEEDVGASWSMKVRLQPLNALADVPVAEARQRWTTLIQQVP